MPQRGIDSNLWIHCDFETVSIEAKLLFIYLCTSPRGNQAGLYRITYKGISKDTGLSESKIEQYLRELSVMDVVYFIEDQVIWIKNFLRHQAHSPQFLQAVAKCLALQKNKNLVIQYLKYNDTISIPYEYPIDTNDLPENTVCLSVLESESESVLESESGTVPPDKILGKQKKLYGEFNNVKLTDDEHLKLITSFGENQAAEKIENLSQYIASKGKKYSSHYATILNWERKNTGGNNGANKYTEYDR